MVKVNRVKLHKCILKTKNNVIFNIDSHTDSYISVIYQYENAMGYNYVPIFSGSELVKSIPMGLGNMLIYPLIRPESLEIRNFEIGGKVISFKDTMNNINTWTKDIATTLNNNLSKMGFTDKGQVGTNLYGYYFPKVWTGLANRVTIGLKIQLQSNKDTTKESYRLYKQFRKYFQLNYIGHNFPDFYLYTGNSNTFFFNNEILQIQLKSAEFKGKSVDFSKPITSVGRFPIFLDIDLAFELVNVYNPDVNMVTGEEERQRDLVISPPTE